LERKFIRYEGEVVTLENFNLCGEPIPKLKGSEAFKYLGEHKEPASSVTNKKPILPPKSNGKKETIHKGKQTLQKYKIRIIQLDILEI